MPAQLPQELVDEVIDYLFNDTRTLKRCSILSSSWSHRSRVHLWFHTIVKSREMLPGLINILKESPWIARLMKRLTIYDAHNLDEEWNDQPFDLDILWAHWATTHQSRSLKSKYIFITTHLQIPFSSLQVLCLSGVRFDSFFHAVRFLSSNRNITELSLVRIHYPPKPYIATGLAKIVSFPNLTRLRLDTPQLLELVEFFSLVPGLRIESLEVREQYIQFTPDASLLPLLRATGRSLKELKVVLTPSNTARPLSWYCSMDLKANPCLESLSIHGLSDQGSAFSNISVARLIASASSPRIRRITLGFRPLYPKYFIDFSELGWQTIEEVISGPRFCDLEQLQIIINSEFEYRDEELELAKCALSRLMPVSAIRGILVVEDGGPWSLRGYSSKP